MIPERISVHELHGETGIPVRSLQNFVSRTNPVQPTAADLALICEAAGLSVENLLSGVIEQIAPDMALTGPRAAGEMISIPRYNVQASAGGGALVLSEDVHNFMSVNRAWLAKLVPISARVGIIEAKGDSMHPTIAHGDVLFITMDIDEDTVAGGGIFALSVDGVLRVKRLQVLMSGDMKIISDNSLYDPEVISNDDLAHRVIIHGRVFWSGGPTR